MRREDTRTLQRELGPRAHHADDDLEYVYRSNYREWGMLLPTILANFSPRDMVTAPRVPARNHVSVWPGSK